MPKKCICCGYPSIEKKTSEKIIYQCLNCQFTWTNKATPNGLRVAAWFWKSTRKKGNESDNR